MGTGKLRVSPAQQHGRTPCIVSDTHRELTSKRLLCRHLASRQSIGNIIRERTGWLAVFAVGLLIAAGVVESKCAQQPATGPPACLSTNACM